MGSNPITSTKSKGIKMFISKSSITQLAGGGYLTVQIPTLYLYTTPGPHPQPTDMITIPDDYVCWFSSNGLPSVKSGKGFLFLTRKGFNAFYEELKVAFEMAFNNGIDRTNGVGWQAFVDAADDYFAELDTKKKRELKKLRDKGRFLKNWAI